MISRPTDGVWALASEDLLGAPVAPGVWLTSLPFPTPLKYSFSYLLETAGGLVVVDLGWNTHESWHRFLTGLSRAGKNLDDVCGVVVTHVHPDHYGLAGRLRQATNAWIGIHPGERAQLAPDPSAAQRRIEDMADWLRVCGASAADIDSLRAESADLAAHFPSILPDVDLLDRGPVPGTEGMLVPLHTPGHTPGHLCFHDRERGLLFTGDHLLPRITPNISKRPTSDEDPVLDYTGSLRLVQSLDTRSRLFALPGHEWGFGQVGHRAAEIDGHHGERLAEIESAVRAGCSTVWEVAQAVPWSRPFAELSPRARRSAIGETHAHLYRLHILGAVLLSEDVPERWTPTVAPAGNPAAGGSIHMTSTRRLTS